MRTGRGPGVAAALLALAALGALPERARALSLADCTAPGADCTLREVADLVGLRLGAAAASGYIASDPLYGPTLAAEFNSLTPENHLKWPQIHPAPDTWNFGPADALVDFATAAGMRIRGHTLLWANPDRLPAYVAGATSAAEARAYMADHITTLVGRYAGRIDTWDVVNEPLENLGDVLFDNVFLDQIGPGYIGEAFQLAHAADPTARLFLNEVLVEIPGSSRFDAFYDLVKGLVDAGVPIDGVGFQTHLLSPFIQPTGAQLEDAMRRFADLGLGVEITEMDVGMTQTAGDRLGLQAQIYADLIGACVRVAACEGITFWGFTDRYTWLDAAFGPGLDPLPFDVDYGRKPAWFATRDALLARLPEPAPGALLAPLAAALVLGARRSRRRGRAPALPAGRAVVEI